MTAYFILAISFLLVLTIGQVCALLTPALHPVRTGRARHWRRHVRSRQPASHRRHG